MSATTKIAVGVASGYLLGRRKKLRLAMTVGSMLAGRKLASARRIWSWKMTTAANGR